MPVDEKNTIGACVEATNRLVTKVFFSRHHTGTAFAAAALHAIFGDRRALDVTRMGNGDRDVFALDQRLVFDLDIGVDQFGEARRSEFRLHDVQLASDDAQNARPRTQDFEIILDRFAQLLHFLADFFAAESGETLQADIEDGLGLFLGQPDGAVFGNRISRIGNQRHQRTDIFRRPGARHQLFARRVGIRCGADQRNHFVDIGDRDAKPGQDMRTVARLAELETRALGDDLFAEHDKRRQQVFQIHLLRHAVVQGQHVDAEARLQFGKAIELVQHDVGRGVAAQFDHHAHAVPVAFVANVGDAFDALVAHQLGNFLLHARLVHLIGNLGDDDGLAILADFFHMAARPHQDRAASARQRAARRLLADDQRAGGKIRTRHDFGQRIEADRRIVDIGETGIDHFPQIVGRHIGRHAHGNAAGAVDQKIGKAGGKDDRFLFRTVVIVLEIDGFLVDIFGKRMGDLGAAHFGVTHRGGRIAVDRTEIALPVDQRRAHGEFLRHAHQRVVNRLIAMGVVFADDVADHAGGFAIGLVPVVAVLVHRKENAPVHWLEPVAGIGQSARNDHAHRIVEIGAFELVFDGNGIDAKARRRGRGRRSIAQIQVPVAALPDPRKTAWLPSISPIDSASERWREARAFPLQSEHLNEGRIRSFWPLSS